MSFKKFFLVGFLRRFCELDAMGYCQLVLSFLGKQTKNYLFEELVTRNYNNACGPPVITHGT